MYLTDASRFLISCVIQHYAAVMGWGGGGVWRNRCIMLNMTLDPSWRQTLRLPPPGIEPGSPASQAGTLPKELSRQLIPELRIRDLYPRSRILIYPGSWIQNSNKREGWKKICCHNILCSHKFHKKFSKIWGWDPGSEIRYPEKTYSGSRGQKGTISHALSLPPPGIEPGLPASQAGTLPKELSRQLILRVVGATHLTAREGSNLPSPPRQNLPQPVEISITIQHNSMGPGFSSFTFT